MAETQPIQLPIDAGVLPPRRTGEGPVFAAIQDETTGLPAVTPAEAQPYKPKFSLDYADSRRSESGPVHWHLRIRRRVVSLQRHAGNHVLATSAQVTNRFDEFGGSAFYLNRYTSLELGVVSMRPVHRARLLLDSTRPTASRSWSSRSSVSSKSIEAHPASCRYPFSAARRVEFSGGLRQITLSEDVTARTFDQFGQQLSQDSSTLASFPNLNLGQAAAALVYDTSISGVTSPIKGTRYRVELSQSAGSLTYTGALVDYRMYVMPVKPYTFALRGLYFGRFGADSEDERLPTLYLGYPGLVRGYDSGSFEAGECGAQINGSCPAIRSTHWQPRRSRERRVPFPALGLVQPRSLLWAATNRGRRFRRYRGRMESRHIAVVHRRSQTRLERRRRRARQCVRLCDRGVRLRASAQSARARMDLAVQSQSGLLNR